MDLARLRKEFPVVEECIYFNNAAMAPVPLSVRQAVAETYVDREIPAEVRTERREGMELRVREKLARLMNAETEEITYITNTSDGINIIALGAEMERGDNVVIPHGAFPALIYPWMWRAKRDGIEIRFAQPKEGYRVTEEDIIARVDERTKVVAVSHVNWMDGYRLDLKKLGEFCEERGILFAVNTTHSLGAMVIDVKRERISALFASAFKWLLAPAGIGVLFVSKDWLSRIKPTYVSYLGMTTEMEDLSYRFEFCPDAERFRTGNINYLGLAGLNRSLDIIFEFGPRKIEERDIALTEMIVEGLEKRGYVIRSARERIHRSSIINFSGRNIPALYDHLLKHKVVVSRRADGIRVSPHFYNSEDEVERMLEIVDGFSS